MRILLIEDDKALCGIVSYALEKEGHIVDACHEGDDGLRWLRERAHDLVLLDRMLPRLDGASLLRRAREEEVPTPVIMITALGTVEDRVDGLDVGADDYLVKPFATKELLARIRALGRRPRAWAATEQAACGDLALDPDNKLLRCRDREISLSRREAELLAFLIKNAGATLPRATLLSHVWGPDALVEEGNLDSYIYFLRQRLKAVASAMEIATVRGVGYALREGRGENR